MCGNGRAVSPSHVMAPREERQGEHVGDNSSLASIIPTFCNAVQALECQQRQERLPLFQQQQQREQTADLVPGTAACSRSGCTKVEIWPPYRTSLGCRPSCSPSYALWPEAKGVPS